MQVRKLVAESYVRNVCCHVFALQLDMKIIVVYMDRSLVK